MPFTYEWRGAVTSTELNALHAEAFDTSVFNDDEWDWISLLERHSLGWVVARDGDELVGFANVLWDGLVHAWIQDVMVAKRRRGHDLGTELVARSADGASAAGCEYLHVDFEDELRPFYIDACGFRPASAGLLALASREHHPTLDPDRLRADIDAVIDHVSDRGPLRPRRG